MTLTKSVAEIAPGDHACAVVDSDEQHWEVAPGYLSAGLDRQEKVLGADLVRLGGLHPVEVVAPALYDDGLLRVTRSAPFRMHVSGEVDYSNREPVRLMIAEELERSLRSPGPSGEVEVRLESLRFADVTTVVRFVRAAEAFPQGHRLVLHGAQPPVRRLLDRCGAAFCAQLEVRESGSM